MQLGTVVSYNPFAWLRKRYAAPTKEQTIASELQATQRALQDNKLAEIELAYQREKLEAQFQFIKTGILPSQVGRSL